MIDIHINILVVDDDQICLSVVAGFLQKLKHHVIATKNPINALNILREGYYSFDLILADMHMPEMSGLELLKHVTKESFQIPVILMSADDDPYIMRTCLEDGAAFYYMKPLGLNNLSDIWQFANIRRSRVPPVETPHTITRDSPTNIFISEQEMHNDNIANTYNDNNVPMILTSPDNEVHMDIKNFPNPLLKNEEIIHGKRMKRLGVRRKPKIHWTTSLHSLFLEAVYKIGLDKAMPKKILDYMKVPGLRRENVASHLQKYRIFLKNFSQEDNFIEHGVPCNRNERPLRSSFVLNEITYLMNNLQQQHAETKGQSRSQRYSAGDADPKYEMIMDNLSGDIDIIHRKGASNEIKAPTTVNNEPSFKDCQEEHLFIHNTENHFGFSTSYKVDYMNLEGFSDEHLKGTNNVNFHLPSFGEVYNQISSPYNRDESRKDSVDVQINQEPSINDLGVGLFNVYTESEGFEGLDQGINILLNDDISFESYYAQEFEQRGYNNSK